MGCSTNETITTLTLVQAIHPKVFDRMKIAATAKPLSFFDHQALEKGVLTMNLHLNWPVPCSIQRHFDGDLE
jgi:hypothetical protein